MRTVLVATLALALLNFGPATLLRAGENEPPGQEKDGVPPGLKKKGGVPPGQAKKHGPPQPEKGPVVVVTPPAPAVVVAPAPPPAPAPQVVIAPKVDKPAPPPAPAPALSPRDQKRLLDAQVNRINAATQRPQPLAQAIAQISKETGLPVRFLEQQRRNHPNIGTSALLMGNLIAKESKANFNDLMAQRAKGKTWGEIAEARHVPLGPLMEKADSVGKAIGVADHAAQK